MRKTFTIREWATIVVTVVSVWVIVAWTGIDQKWEDAIIYTVIVFGVVIMALRPVWGRNAFWTSLVNVFALHCIGIAVVVQVLPKRWSGIPDFLELCAGLVEGLLIGGVLWRRATSRPNAKQI